jgi:hypothetical protein
MSNKENFQTLANGCMKDITIAVYTIINIIDELTFDLSIFPTDFETKTKYALEYYKLCCIETNS